MSADAPEGGLDGRALRRLEILDAALQVFSRSGFRGATIKDIAKEAGLKSPANLYWYFEDKDALYFGVLEYFTRGFREDFASLDLELPPLAFLGDWMKSILSRFRDDARTLQAVELLLLDATAPLPGDMSLIQREGGSFDLLTRYLEAQADRGVVDRNDISCLARALTATTWAQVLSRGRMGRLLPVPQSEEDFLRDQLRLLAIIFRSHTAAA